MIRSRAILAVGFGATSVANYAFAIAMGWLLIPHEFGTLAFAQSVILVCGLILQAGVPWSLARAVTHHEDRMPELVRGAFLANLALAAAIGAAAVVLYVAGPLRPGLEHPEILALVAISLLPISVSATARGALQGTGRFGQFAGVQVVEVVMKGLAGTLMVLAGLGTAGAVGGFAIGAFAAAAVSLIWVSRLGVAARGPRLAPEIRCAVPMLGALLGLTLLMNWDLLLLKSLSPQPGIAGQYQAALVIANAPYFLVTAAIVPVLFMRLSRFSELRPTLPYLGEALRAALLITVPLELAAIVAPGSLVGLLFPAGYAGAAPLLQVLALGNILLVVVVVLTTAIRAAGHARLAATTILTVAAVEPVALALVVPRSGATGAAVVFVAAAATATAAVLGVYVGTVRRERASEPLRPSAFLEPSWVLRFSAALAVCCASAGVAAASALGDAAVVGVGLVAYAAALLPLGLVHRPPTEVAR